MGCWGQRFLKAHRKRSCILSHYPPTASTCRSLRAPAGELPLTFPPSDFRTSCSQNPQQSLGPVLLVRCHIFQWLFLPSSAGPGQAGTSTAAQDSLTQPPAPSLAALHCGQSLVQTSLGQLCPGAPHWNITGLCWLALCLRTSAGIEAGAVPL